MRIKKLFKTEQEYLDYAWSFINLDENKIWREEDLPKLKPFFAFENKHRGDSYKLNEEEKESFDYYNKCYEEYAKEIFRVRDSIRGFNIDDLVEFFLLQHIDMNCYDYDKDGNEIDEEGNIIPPLGREALKISEDWKEEMTFPLVFVGWIDSGFDRMGSVRMSFSDFVSLNEYV
jgi:hypothetical protein